ncbi:transporter substrate-binding domain-containing protein [Endozoicomonas sp. SM1973]|uniref:Transporter substrate-binding domain-containing protein n=1 Tax=Spartinivicinus marinus TaxID=2994442 RepID=A0A853I0Y8_9GAMM|nr:transporter substrate-binding domain-containing protein [Spartinivicinus marinus]MCX4029478.1 transporter substrate-binding domain-containing protein [Spartinivicinus marinus]NYZ65052.1 transporter substrate-binding domain-containing protein [Spartinivicinus marinus]
MKGLLVQQLITFILLINLSLQAYCQEVQIVTENFPPYNFEKAGKIEGMSTEILLAALEEAKLKPKISIYPWARAYDIALNTKNYMIYSIAKIPERENLFQWVGAIAPYKTSLYKLKERTDINIQSLDDAKQYSIGCSISDVITTYLKKQGFSQLRAVSNDTQNLRKLLLGRIDLIAFDEASFVHNIKKEGLAINKYSRVYRLEDLSDELYIAFNKNSDAALVEKVRNALATIQKKGVIQSIHKKYFF